MEEHKMDGEKRLEETCLERKVVYKGKSYEFFVDRVELPDGTEAVREMVKHPGGVAILAMDGENRVLMEEQYRYAICQTITEIPAGKMDKIPGNGEKGRCGRGDHRLQDHRRAGDGGTQGIDRIKPQKPI